MKEILKIVPDIKIMASPWSAPAWMKESKNVRGGAPAWMKESKNVRGGALKNECYDAYARYFNKICSGYGERGY